jgi:hypothetical protein
MRKLIIIAILCLSLSVLGFSSGLSFKATGGLSLLLGGDYNKIVEGTNDFNEEVNATSLIKTLNLGMTFQGEVIYQLTENIGVGLGAGYISASNEGTFEESSLQQIYTPNVTAIPVTLNFHYFMPIGSNVNFHFFVGPGIYFAKVKFSDELIYPPFAVDLTTDFQPESKTVFGFQGGLGLELGLSPNLFFVLDAMGRMVNISDLTGPWTMSGTLLGFSVNASGTGTFWYEEFLYGGDYYAGYEIASSKPSGTGLRNVKEGSFSLTGVTVQAGFRITL